MRPPNQNVGGTCPPVSPIIAAPVSLSTVLCACRYYAIKKPMKARYVCTLSHAKKLVILLWIASFLLALPIIKGQVTLTHWRIEGGPSGPPLPRCQR